MKLKDIAHFSQSQIANPVSVIQHLSAESINARQCACTDVGDLWDAYVAGKLESCLLLAPDDVEFALSVIEKLNNGEDYVPSEAMLCAIRSINALIGLWRKA